MLLNFEGAFNKCSYTFISEDYSLLCLAQEEPFSLDQEQRLDMLSEEA